MSSRPLYEFPCAACGERSSAHRAATTCSDACRSALYRRRQRERNARTRADLRAGLGGDPNALALGLSAALHG